MKGFIHIVEIIIIALVVFVVIVQFSLVPRVPSEADRVKLRLLAADTLHALDARGLQWQNASAVAQGIEQALGGSAVAYRVELRNAVKSAIRVGCVCSSDELALLQDILEPIQVNHLDISFLIQHLPPPDLANPPAIPVTNDVTVFFSTPLADENTFPPYSYRDPLETALRAGTGVIVARDLDLDAVSSEELSLFQRYFNLTRPDPLAVAGGDPLQFTDPAPFTLGNPRLFALQVPVYYDDFAGQEGFAEAAGSWSLGSGTYTAAGEPAFAALPGSPPANYSVRLNLSFLPEGDHAGWSPAYQGEGDWVLAGVDMEGFLVIRNDSTVFAFRNLAGPLVVGTVYPVEVNVTGRDIAVTAWEGGSPTSLAFRWPVPLAGQYGLLANATTAGQHASFSDFALTLGGTVDLPAFLDPAERAAIPDGARNDSILLREESTGLPALVANDGIPAADFLPGRSVWLTGGWYDPATGDQEAEGRALLKAAVLWAAGDAFALIPNTVPNPETVSLITAADGDFFQPLEVLLRLDYVFGRR